MRSASAAALSGIALSFALGPLLAGCRPPEFGNQLSTRQEVRIGRQAASQIESQYPVVSEGDGVDAVNAIAARIVPQASRLRADVAIRVKVLKSDQADAFSLPGGWVYVDTGLLDKIGTDRDALAFVIGHELAHVALRHAATELTTATGNEELVDLLTQGKYQEAANVAIQLDMASHGKDDEYDADRLGLKFVQQAGCDPQGALRLFALLQTPARPGAGSGGSEWLQTHPLSSGRFRRVQQDIADLRAGKY